MSHLLRQEIELLNDIGIDFSLLKVKEKNDEIEIKNILADEAK